MKATHMSIDGWIDKEDVVMEYYSAIKKKSEVLPLATTWMNLEGIMLNEISQTEKHEHHIISLTYGYEKQNK